MCKIILNLVCDFYLGIRKVLEQKMGAIMLASTIREYGSTDKPSYARTHAHMHPRRIRAHNIHRSQHICA